MLARINRFNNYLKLVKFSHTIFAMPFALIGFGLAVKFAGPFPAGEVLQKLGFVIAAMVFARSAAMAFNRYLDRKFDALNPRTAIREVPSGIISSRNALLFTVMMAVLFMITTLFINKLCFFLSPVALFVILFYSYTKRFTALCHLVLGLGLSLAPVGAWLALAGYFAWLPVMLGVAVMMWVAGFDIIYSLQDEDFDKAHKLHSIPAMMGKRNALLVSRMLHVVCATLIVWFGWAGGFSWLFWIGAGLFCGMLGFQQSIVKANDLRRVNLAFMTANGFASLALALFTLLDLFILNKI